jgi:putative membrane protein
MASELDVPPLPADAGWTRLHPTTLLFATGARLYQSRGLILPAGLAVVVSRGRRGDSGWHSWESWLAIPLVLLLLHEVIHYLTFRYRLDPHEIVVKSGLFWKSVRHIPYARVQNIELVQHALHRVAGVAVVRLDTGTGAGAEATLTVLSLEAIDALRAAVRQGRLDAATSETPAASVDRGRVLSALTVRELALHGLLTGRGTVVIAALLGAIWQGQLDWLGLGRFVPSRDWLWGQVTHATPVLALELTAVVLAASLLFRLASAVWSVIKHYDFSLVARGPELFQSYGAITRVGQTIPQGRIQKLTVVEPLGMRWLRRATLNVDTAASAKDKHGEQQAHGGRTVLVPIVPTAQVAPLVRDVHPPGTIDDRLVDFDALAWQHVDPRAFRRLARVRLIAMALLFAPLAVGIGWQAAGLVVASGAALLVASAWFDATRTAFAWSGEALIFRSGAWTRQTSLVRVARAQVVSMTQSPFDRRWGMATVSVDTAGSSGGHAVAIPWLSDDVADSLYAHLRHAASAS